MAVRGQSQTVGRLTKEPVSVEATPPVAVVEEVAAVELPEVSLPVTFGASPGVTEELSPAGFAGLDVDGAASTSSQGYGRRVEQVSTLADNPEGLCK